MKARMGAKVTDHINKKGYVVVGTGRLEHVAIAEKAFGGPLPNGAQVHHVNENCADNRGENLVICPDAAYHKLLHRRMRALDACGNANWLSCKYCHQYDDPSNMYVNPKNIYHWECCRKYNRQRKGWNPSQNNRVLKGAKSAEIF